MAIADEADGDRTRGARAGASFTLSDEVAAVVVEGRAGGGMAIESAISLADALEEVEPSVAASRNEVGAVDWVLRF